MKSVDKILRRFERIKQVKPNHWMARCPSHNDGVQPDQFSLSITALPDKLLINCLAGCHIDAVLAALKLEMKDLFFDNPSRKTHDGDDLKEIEKTYDYQDIDGDLLFQVVRFKPKAFSQRRPDGKGGWIWGLRGVTRVIYHLPEIADAILNGESIYFCEGEKDADNLIRLGLIATTNPMGAGKFRPEYAKMLTGASLITVIPDNDSPGKKHMEIVARSLSDSEIPVKELEVPEPHKDISDWISAGLTREEIEKKVDELPLYTSPVATVQTAIPKYNLTDMGNAERLVARHGQNIRYCYQRNSWIFWTGIEWRWDTSGNIYRLAQETVRNIYKEAEAEEEPDQRKLIIKHARTSESNGKIRAMIEQAQAMATIEMSYLDKDDWKLNCLNGTIDLKSGTLNPHCHEDFITMTCPVNYDPNGHRSLWDAFLNRIFEGNQNLITYIQRCMGYTVTGSTMEQCLFFCWGTGQNGKSTLLNTFRNIVGPYFIQADTDMFMAASNPGRSGHTEDVANLAGKRFVAATEVEEGRRLAVNKLKSMTGGEPVTASRKYEHAITFEVTYKIWLTGNHKPEITDTTYSIWRRVKLVKFNVQIPEAEQDKNLWYKLRDEYPAVLAWIVQGCLDWQKDGLNEPKEVKAATETYRQGQDVLGDFFEDCCIIRADAAIAKNELLEAYNRWSVENGIPALPQKVYNRRVEEKGMITHRGSGGKRTWRGIRLRHESEDPQVNGSLSQRTLFDENSDASDESDPNSIFFSPARNNNHGEEDMQNPVTNGTCVTFREEVGGEPAAPEDMTPIAGTAEPNPKGLTRKAPQTEDDFLSQSELKQMLESYIGISVEDMVGFWKQNGSPKIPLSQGITISDLEKFVTLPLNLKSVAAISEWYTEAMKSEDGGGTGETD